VTHRHAPEERDRRRAHRQGLAGVLLVLGIALWAIVLGTSVRSCLARRPAEWKERPGALALGRASLTRREAQTGASLGWLEIPRIELSVPLVEGVDRRALITGAGHVPGTAFPGEPDNAAFAAHRDTHFEKLRGIMDGDTIRMETPDGTFLYAVDSSFVVAPDRGDLLWATGRPMLTLVTCYPFRWIGPAPKRFIVRARAVGIAGRA
jgi:sortase A